MTVRSRIGLAVYGLGSLTTALSPNLYVLLFGWSLVEGLGAVLVIPAIAALVAANYEGKDRAFAYGIIGGVAGAAIAVGPVIGGWVTTYYSWRLVFVGEVVIVIAILLVRKRMQPAPRPDHPPRLDVVGAALSAAGLGLIVFGILQSSKWGWLQPLDAPTIGGNEITPLGFSLVPFLIVGGVFLLWFFSMWEERRERLGQDTLLDRALLRIESLRAGLATLMSQQLVLMGTFFVLPVYLQVVLGLDAFETGKRLLPMSVTMLIAALAGPKLAARLAPRLVVQIGLVRDGGRSARPGRHDRRRTERDGLQALARAVRGRRRPDDVAARQRDHVVGAAGEDERGRRPPGHGPEPRRLTRAPPSSAPSCSPACSPASTTRIAENPALSEPVRAEITAATEQGIEIVTTEQAHAVAISAGLSPAEADAVTADYADAQLDALKKAMLAVALLALLSLVFTRRLPGRPATVEPAATPSA